MVKMQNFVMLIQIASLLCKNRYLQRYSRRCWNKIWYLKFEIDRTLPEEKNKDIIGLMKDELGEQMMQEFIASRTKAHS